MTDITEDESRRAFEEFRSITCETTVPLEQFERIHWEVWQAAEKWARQDERERLARLAESLNPMRPLSSWLSAKEIRRGGIDE